MKNLKELVYRLYPFLMLLLAVVVFFSGKTWLFITVLIVSVVVWLVVVGNDMMKNGGV